MLLMLCRGLVSLAFCHVKSRGCCRYGEVVEDLPVLWIDGREMTSYLVNEKAGMCECSAIVASDAILKYTARGGKVRCKHPHKVVEVAQEQGRSRRSRSPAPSEELIDWV